MPPPKWSDVIANEQYRALPDDEKSKVRQRYFDNVISKNPVYSNLADSEKMKVQERFFGEARPSMVERVVSGGKDFFIDKPGAGAKVLRGAAVDAVAPDESDIESQAAETGEVPYGKIALRTAAATAADFVPLTPTEFAGEILGAKAAAILYRAAPMLMGKFPTLFKIMRSRIGFARKAGAEAVGEEVAEAALSSTPLADDVAIAISDATPAIPEGGIAPDVPAQSAAPGVEMAQEGAEAAVRSMPEPAAMSDIPPAGVTPPLAPDAPKMGVPLAAKKPKTDLPEGTVGRILATKGPAPEKDIFGQQLNKFNVADDARAVFDETSNIFKDKIDVARRGKIDFAGTEKYAKSIGMDVEDLVKRNRGQALNAEQLEALKGMTARSLEDVMAAKNIYKDVPTPENLLKLTGAIAKHAVTQTSFMAGRAEAGRALSILRKITDPANRGAENIEKVLRFIGGDEGVPQAVAKRLAMIDPNDVKQLSRFARSVVKAKTSDQVHEIWLNGILSSPLSHVKNVMGNTVFLASKVPEKLIQGVVDRAGSMFTGKRAAYAGEAVPEAMAFLRGIPEGVRRFLYTAVKGGGKGQLELDRLPAVPGKIGEAVRIPTRLLNAEDEMAKSIATRMELAGRGYRIAKSEGLKGRALINRLAELEANPTDEMLEAASKEALVRTFQSPSKFADTVSSLRKIPGVRYVLPFIRTPVNIAGAAIDRSPVGFFKAIHSGLTGKGQAKVTEDVAKALYGSSIAATVAYYTLQGRVTGAPPKDPVARDRFFRTKIPYGIKIGDTWYSYASFEPMSMVVGATADSVLRAVESGEKDDTTLSNAAGAITSSISRYLVSRTFLSGIHDFIEAMADGENKGDAFIKRMAGSAVPYSGMMRYISYQMDPLIRETSGAMDQIKSGIPGLSKTLRPRLDAYGDEIRRPSGPLAASAIASKREVPNPMDFEDDEIDRVSGFPARTIGGVKLRDDEYHEVLRISGRTFKEARLALQKTDGWKEIPAEGSTGRKAVINALAEATRREARASVYLRVLDRLPAGDKREDLIEYGVNNMGLDPDDLMQRPVRK